MIVDELAIDGHENVFGSISVPCLFACTAHELDVFECAFRRTPGG